MHRSFVGGGGPCQSVARRDRGLQKPELGCFKNSSSASVELRPSSGAKYLGVTITVNATSREQLDELYRTLSTHPMVKVVL